MHTYFYSITPFIRKFCQILSEYLSVNRHESEFKMDSHICHEQCHTLITKAGKRYPYSVYFVQFLFFWKAHIGGCSWGLPQQDATQLVATQIDVFR